MGHKFSHVIGMSHGGAAAAAAAAAADGGVGSAALNVSGISLIDAIHYQDHYFSLPTSPNYFVKLAFDFSNLMSGIEVKVFAKMML